MSIKIRLSGLEKLVNEKRYCKCPDTKKHSWIEIREGDNEPEGLDQPGFCEICKRTFEKTVIVIRYGSQLKTV
jgi:hypothetical protein